jgi:HEAT repeat protein
MFDIHAMRNEGNNYSAFPRRILSLAILAALIVVGGLVRQSAAQEPSPRIKIEPAPGIKIEVAPPAKVYRSSLDDLDEQLSLLDKMDLSSLDNLDLSYLDKMELLFIDKMDFSFPDKMYFPQGKGIGRGVGLSVAGSGNQADDDPCEFKIVVLQALIQNDPPRGIAVATDWLKPGSAQTVRCKQAALSLLAHHGGKAVTPVILGFARNEPDLKLRTKAISVLGSTNDESVIDTLRDFALTSTENEIIEAALYALSQHNSDRAVTVLGEIATSNRPVPLRRAAISNIAGRPGEPALDTLLKIYDTDQNVEIRKSVINGFSRRRSERAGAKMLEIAQRSDNVELRKAAISGIARRSGEQAMDILLGLYDSEKDEAVKDQIMNSFGNFNDPRVTRKLIEIAKNPQTPIARRKRAIGWLSRSKDPAVLQFLEDLLKQ